LGILCTLAFGAIVSQNEELAPPYDDRESTHVGDIVVRRQSSENTASTDIKLLKPGHLVTLKRGPEDSLNLIYSVSCSDEQRILMWKDFGFDGQFDLVHKRTEDSGLRTEAYIDGVWHEGDWSNGRFHLRTGPIYKYNTKSGWVLNDSNAGQQDKDSSSAVR
jgi:hypothetical protein